MKAIILLFLLFQIPVYTNAQEYPRKEIDLQEIADDLYGFQDLNLNYEDLYENIAQLLLQPLDLNKASDEELRFLHILSEEQVNDLQQYKKQLGTLLTIYELQVIPSFDSVTIQKIIPFVTVVDPATRISTSLLKRIQHEADNYFVMRYERVLDRKEGFTNEADDINKFKGSPDKYYLRFRSSRPGDFSFGFTAEKDAGEPMHWEPQKHHYGFDYFSVHAQVQNKGRVRNLIVGDYQAQFGQGLMLGGIFGMGKGGETISTTRRSNVGFLPYTSAYESGLLRGGAATIEVNKHIYLSGFYANVNRDANLEDMDSEYIVTSFQTTGLHRNEKELSNRKKINEQNFGGVIQYKKDQLDAGILFNQINYNQNVIRNGTLYNQFYFEGKQNQNVGVYLNYTFQNLTFFSEVCKTITGGFGHVAGILGNLSPKFDIALVHRKFSRDFQTFYSNAFAEGSTTRNESGIYWGWKYTFNRKVSLSGYTDLFRFPWIKYRSYVPSTGHEFLLRLTYQPSRKIIVLLQGREEKKVRNITDLNDQLYLTAEGTKRNYLFNCQYSINPQLKLRTRIQLSTFSINHQTSEGMAIMQDLNYTVGKFEITGRYALFDTQNYDNRQYVYEDDVWLAYSLPAYDGTGVRNYLLLEYKLTPHVSIWMKYAHIRYQDRNEIGTGPDRIKGNVRDDLKLQVRVKF